VLLVGYLVYRRVSHGTFGWQRQPIRDSGKGALPRVVTSVDRSQNKLSKSSNFENAPSHGELTSLKAAATLFLVFVNDTASVYKNN
jgi:hypothetical protein